MPKRELSPRTYNRLQKTLREIKDLALEIGGKKGEKIHGLADKSLAMVNSLVVEMDMEDRQRPPTSN